MSNNFIVGIGDSGTDINAGQSVSSNTFIGTLAGNAETADKLNHTLTIGDYVFDGSTNIDITTVPIENGGTDATNAKDARDNLGITPANIGALSTANGAVRTNNIADGAITSGKIGDYSVTYAKMTNDAYTYRMYPIGGASTKLLTFFNNKIVYYTTSGKYFRLWPEANDEIQIGYHCRLCGKDYATSLHIDSFTNGIHIYDFGNRRDFLVTTAANTITIPINRYMDIIKVADDQWILSGNYAEPFIFGGTSAPSGGNPGDIYVQYS